jgi:hypothetical protein
MNAVEITGYIIAILKNVETGETRIYETHNIVTNAGDRFLAEQAVNGALNKNFLAGGSGFRLGTGTNAPAKTDADVQTFLSGSAKIFDGGYPRTNDPDVDNTGAGVNVVTWRVTYGTTEANGSGINELVVVDDITTPTAAFGRALFSAPFTKTGADTLKVIYNDLLAGV